MATRHRGRDWTDLSALIVSPLRQARCQTSRTSNQSLRRGASRVLCPTPRHLARACSFRRQKRKETPAAHRAYGDRNHRKRGPSMRISSLVLALLLVTGAPGALAAQPELKTEEQKTLYALGRESYRGRQGEGALPRHADRRNGVRQLGPARRTHHVSAERRDQVLDRRRAADEGRWQEPARLSRRHRLRRSRRPAQDQAGRDAGLRGRAA